MCHRLFQLRQIEGGHAAFPITSLGGVDERGYHGHGDPCLLCWLMRFANPKHLTMSYRSVGWRASVTGHAVCKELISRYTLSL
jgi:hypothetical protein